MKEDYYTSTPQDAARYEANREDFADEGPDCWDYMEDETGPDRRGELAEQASARVRPISSNDLVEQLRDFTAGRATAEKGQQG